MSGEASKTRAIRGPEFEKRFLSGRVIDIGCGPDIVVPHAEPFDLEHGDAQRIANQRPIGAYDAVHSSHCLEHMRDVPAALEQWWALVRPGGYLILIVPDEDLYEQGGWPSLFNSDHRATFRIRKQESWSPVSYDLLQLVSGLEGSEIVSCEVQQQGYERGLRKLRITRVDRLLFRVQHLVAAALRRGSRSAAPVGVACESLFRRLGTPVDQTAGAALAQIQIVARKRP